MILMPRRGAVDTLPGSDAARAGASAFFAAMDGADAVDIAATPDYVFALWRFCERSIRRMMLAPDAICPMYASPRNDA